MSVAQQVDAWDELLDFLLTAPTPQQIVEYRASDAAQERLRILLDKNRNGRLSDDEESELEQISQFDQMMAQLKVRAYKRLQVASGQ